MIPTFGYLMLALGFLLALYGVIMLVWGMIEKSQACVESARLAMLLIFPLISLSVIAMLILLLNNRVDVLYVYQVTNASMPTYLRMTALWGGQSGSLLFWSWLLSGFSMIFALQKRVRRSDLFPWASLVLCIILGFFLAMNLFIDNPFESFWILADGSWVISMFQPSGAEVLTPMDGQGLNPLLRHPGMILHPPALYLGFVGFAVPFALAVGTLATGRKDRQWIAIARPWILFAWAFLSLGLILGMRWAYDVLGWGGYWGWDPVEVSALMPWLSATALVHTCLLQEHREGYRRWNIIMAVLTFSLVIFSVFVTRSGVITSVHAFAESAVGFPLLVLLLLLFLGSLGLLFVRWRSLRGTYDPLFGFNRETLTLFSSLVLLCILGVCFIGVMYPLGSELLTGVQMTVGEVWYERITGPLLFLLLLLTGICPLIGWSAAYFKDNRQRFLIMTLLSLAFPLLAWLLGVRHVLVAVALWLAGFGALTILSAMLSGIIRNLRKSAGRTAQGVWDSIQKQSRRIGAAVVHLGIVLIGIGIIGIEGMQQETQVVLSQGESAGLGAFQFTYQGLETYIEGDEIAVTEATLRVSRNGREIGFLSPKQQVYTSLNQSVMQPGVKSNLIVDVYAVMISGSAITEDEAAFTIYINPLVKWLWIGAGMLTAGTLLAALPDKKRS